MTIGMERGEIAEIGSPVDVPTEFPIPDQDLLRWTTVTIAIAAAVLTLGNAGAIQEWIDEMPAGRSNDWLRPPIASLHKATGAVGLDIVHATIRCWWKKAEAARFGDEKPGDPGTA